MSTRPLYRHCECGLFLMVTADNYKFKSWGGVIHTLADCTPTPDTVTIRISREQALYWAAEDNEDGHLPYYSHWAEEMTDGCRAALREDG